MELNFDGRGNLQPYQCIEVTFEEFTSTFVTAFDKNSTRHPIFDQYRQYLKDFSEQISDNFTQWINGSFISNRRNPKDIDFVTIIDHIIFEQKESIIERQFRLLGAREKYQVDAYTVRKYPEDHPKYGIFQNELIYWEHWFSQTKKNRAKLKFNKGFISIHFRDFQNVEL